MATDPSNKEAELATVNVGSNLYRAYLLDVDSDPDTPIVMGVFKRGDEYPDIQSRIRAILKGEGKDGDRVFKDRECLDPIAPEDLGDNWNLTLVRKQRSTMPKGGVDRIWLAQLMADESKSPEEKMAAIATLVKLP